MARPYADGGDDQAGERGRILEQDDEIGGILGMADRRPPAHPPLACRKFAQREIPRRAFHQESDAEDDVVERCAGHLLGLDDVEPAFVDRYARADREDQDRDDERPEIQFAAIAERVIRSEAHTSELQSLMRISYAVFC